MQNFSFWRGWEVFLSKKRQFFSCKISVFGGLGALFGNFFVDFLAFFLNIPAPPEGERAKRARLTRDADSRCTLAGGPRELFFAPRVFFNGRQRGSYALCHEPLSLFAADLLLPWSSVARYEGTTPPSQLWKWVSEVSEWVSEVSEATFGPLNFFIFRYVEGGVLGNNNICIKKCRTTFLWE